MATIKVTVQENVNYAKEKNGVRVFRILNQKISVTQLSDPQRHVWHFQPSEEKEGEIKTICNPQVFDGNRNIDGEIEIQ